MIVHVTFTNLDDLVACKCILCIFLDVFHCIKFKETISQSSMQLDLCELLWLNFLLFSLRHSVMISQRVLTEWNEYCKFIW